MADFDVYLQDRPALRLWLSTLRDPVGSLCSIGGLGSAMSPLSRFPMPKGRRDGKWLAQRDLAMHNLENLWGKPRDAQQDSLETRFIP